MPILSLIVPKYKIVLTRAFEELVDEELREHESQLGNHGEFSADFRQIIDARFVLKNNTSDQGMAEVAKSTPFESQSRRAIVVIREESFEDARKFSNNTSSQQFQVTRDMGGAIQWMDLSYAKLEAHIKFLEKRAKAAPEGNYVEIVTEEEAISTEEA